MENLVLIKIMKILLLYLKIVKLNFLLFYGVKSKNIELQMKKSKCIEIDDINAFETVFSKSDDFWKDKNNQSLDKIIEVNKILEKISSVVFKERYTNE